MAVSPRARAEFFVETLSSSLKDDLKLPPRPRGPGCEDETGELLRKGLSQAISGLPKCKLKRELEENFQEYYLLFLSKMELHFNLPKDTKGANLRGEEDSEKDEIKREGKESETAQMDTSGGDIVDKALMKISALDNCKERCSKYQILVRSCCYQNVSSLTTILDEWAGLLCSCHVDSNFDLFTDAVRNVTLLTGGAIIAHEDQHISSEARLVSYDEDIISSWMAFCKRLFCHLDDHCLTLSKENFEKFQEMVSNIVTVARMRLLSPPSKASLSVCDSLTAILSTYMTLSINKSTDSSGPKQEVIVSHLVNIVDMFFGTSPQYFMDILLQVNTQRMQSDRSRYSFVHLCRTAVCRVTEVNSFKQYVQFIVVCSMAQDMCSHINETPDRRAIEDACSKVPIPQGFLQWLNSTAGSLVKRICPSQEGPEKSLSLLLTTLNQSTREELLELCQSLKNIDGTRDDKEDGRSNPSMMFYVDTSGDRSFDSEEGTDDTM